MVREDALTLFGFATADEREFFELLITATGVGPKLGQAALAVLTLLEAPVRSIAGGDDFIVRAGCDKRMETCGAKFANTANFRGFPHIPGQDAVLRYATKDGGHEGGVL